IGARSSVHTAGPAPPVVVAARASGRLHSRPASNLMIITTAKPLHVRRRATIHPPSCACLLITGQDNNMRFGQRALYVAPQTMSSLLALAGPQQEAACTGNQGRERIEFHPARTWMRWRRPTSKGLCVLCAWRITARWGLPNARRYKDMRHATTCESLRDAFASSAATPAHVQPALAAASSDFLLGNPRIGGHTALLDDTAAPGHAGAARPSADPVHSGPGASAVDPGSHQGLQPGHCY